MLLKLCSYPEDSVREASATSLLEILQEEAIVYFQQFPEDPVISKAVDDYISDRSS